MKRLAWKAFAAAWLTCSLAGCGPEFEAPAEETVEQAPLAPKGPPPEERVGALASGCSGTIALASNVPVSNISANTGEWSCTYTFNVTSPNSTLKITTTSGTGDADLYVRYGSEPSTTGVNDCKSDQSSNAETCEITNAKVGVYYVKVYGYAAFTGLKLTAVYTPVGSSGCSSTTTMSNGVPAYGVGTAEASWSCIYMLYVPTGATRVDFVTSGGSGDGDLFVRRGSSPNDVTYDCKAAGPTNVETCTLTVTEPGIYYARMYGYHAFSGASITGTYTLTTGQPGCTTTSPLTNNSPTSGVSAPAGTFSCDYTLEVPAGATSVTFNTYGGSGAPAHLYVKRGSAPTLSAYDCAGTLGGSSNNSQTCTLNTPAAGTWHVRLYNAGSSLPLTGATLRGAYVTGGGNPSSGTLVNDVPVSNLSGLKDSYRYWTITVPSGKSSLLVTTTGGTGDADLYVRQGSKPEDYVYDCRPLTGGNTESCLISNPVAGVYHVMIKGYADYAGVTLKATY
ncbi:PPC domain-containing protein [Corallococcus aberystwythensis]|uniref:PPC domain-containing protein n=1 Tax=Corallococcus aberystwythensis TaxID=2316722 RepID=UPI0013157F71|nr:PPC domain-containing protein [Corallococcus aberystwythensis]